MTTSLSLSGALLILIVSAPAGNHEQISQLLSESESPAWQQRHVAFPTFVARDETRAHASKDMRRDSEYRPVLEVKQFTVPTIQLKGTAEEIGLDGRALASLLEATFLQEFTFLQRDYVFEKTYETWEIGLFECEVWTVGSNYPIALHIQCAGGSMDEPRHWQYATLGYGPKDKIREIVTKALDSIVGAYATFVRKGNGKSE